MRRFVLNQVATETRYHYNGHIVDLPILYLCSFLNFFTFRENLPQTFREPSAKAFRKTFRKTFRKNLPQTRVPSGILSTGSLPQNLPQKQKDQKMEKPSAEPSGKTFREPSAKTFRKTIIPSKIPFCGNLPQKPSAEPSA